MAQQINLEVVTPAGAVINEDVDIVNAPGCGGDFGVLANHAPFLSTIKIGALTYETGKTRKALMVSGGFCEVSNNKITFLVESAEAKEDIDADRASEAKNRAEKRISQKGLEGDQNYSVARAEMSLARAVTRLRVAKEL
ncbi:MAG: F0F1 ATP synthase subunit epsilon [Desulfotalea sp.]